MMHSLASASGWCHRWPWSSQVWPSFVLRPVILAPKQALQSTRSAGRFRALPFADVGQTRRSRTSRLAGLRRFRIGGLGFGVGELLTTGFFLAPFAAGGLLAALTDAAGAGEAISVIVFLVSSLLVLGLVRPLVTRRIQSSPPTRTGAAALIGKRALVLERIANGEGVGCVKIDGEVWTARSLDDDREIAAGTRVEVVDIKGATALVME